MSRSKIRTVVMGIAGALVVLTGCSDSDDTKAGGVEPVTLRIGTADDQGRPGAEQIARFAQLADELSDGQVVIEPVWEASGSVENWDQEVARMVVSGELQMGMIPTRAWDTEGVTTLRALQAPFLANSNELVEQIVTGELGEQMIDGLAEAGITGLTLLPENLRHPFGFGAPLLSPADYAGQAFRAPSSEVSFALFEALGARPDDLNGVDFNEAVYGGQVRGAESALALSGSLPGPAYATGNVTFFPKVNSLVINAEVLADLSDEQRAVLVDAAEGTQSWALETLVPEAEAAQEYCGTGSGDVVLATDDELAALEAAAQPVYYQLEQDEATGAMIEQIRILKGRIGSAESEVVACESTLSAPTEGPTPSETQSALDGVYRLEITEADLRGNGVTNADGIAENIGVWTWTLQDGQYSVAQRAPGPQWDEEGRFEVVGDRITFYLSWIDELPMTLTWQLDETSLTLALVGESDPILETTFTAHPWTRIG